MDIIKYTQLCAVCTKMCTWLGQQKEKGKVEGTSCKNAGTSENFTWVRPELAIFAVWIYAI